MRATDLAPLTVPEVRRLVLAGRRRPSDSDICWPGRTFGARTKPTPARPMLPGVLARSRRLLGLPPPPRLPRRHRRRARRRSAWPARRR